MDCPRCAHQEHDHQVIAPLVWCWQCGLPCGKLRGQPEDSTWDVLCDVVQADVDAGIVATPR